MPDLEDIISWIRGAFESPPKPRSRIIRQEECPFVLRETLIDRIERDMSRERVARDGQRGEE